MTHASEDIAALRRQLRLYEALLDAIPNPIFAKDAEAHFCFFNRAYEDFFDMRRGDRLGKTVLDLDYIPQADRERYQREDLDAIERGLEIHYETEYDTRDGKRDALYWSRGITVPDSGEKALVGQIVDITRVRELEKQLEVKVAELEAAQDELKRMCRMDALTGLANRMCFQEQMTANIDFATRYQQPFSVVMADIDHFKDVNDTYGHEVGDDVLRAVGTLLRDICRKGDMPARYGGEEFIIILPMAHLDAAAMAAERIREGMQALDLLPDGTRITLSLGVAEFRQGEDMKELVKRADDALYRAKESGRNRVCY